MNSRPVGVSIKRLDRVAVVASTRVKSTKLEMDR